MNRDLLCTAPQNAVTANLKGHYSSFAGRTQFHQFHFNKERDANMFCRDYNPRTQPGRDFIKGTWVVAL